MQSNPDHAWNSHARLTAATLGLAIFLAQFDVTSVVVAMPMIGADLGIRDAAIAWIIDAYSIAFTATLLIAGALADRFGRRRSLLIGNAWFLSASLCCGLAWDRASFLASRALQGGGAAFLVTGAIASIATAFPDAKSRARAFGFVGVISGIAMALGPSLGGIISTWLGWRWIFLVNLPICVLVALAVPRFVPESRDDQGKPLDWPGVIMLTLALGLVIEALLQAGHSLTRLAFGLAIGMGLIVLFTLRQRRQERPMLDPAVFASRAMMGVASLIAAVSIGYWAVLVYLPLFLNTAFGWTAQQAGMGLLAATLPMLIIPSLSSRIAAQLGWRWLFAIALTTMAIGGLALGVAAVTQTPSAVVWVLGGMTVLGTGAALANPQLSGAVLALAPPEASGMASAIAVIARQGGFAIGVAALGGLLPDNGVAVGFVWLFGGAAIASVAGALACFLLPSPSGNGVIAGLPRTISAERNAATASPAISQAIEHRKPMRKLSPNAQLVSDVFDEIAKGNGKPFWEACHQDVVWRTIGEGSWSGEFSGKQAVIDEVFRPLNRVLAERATIPTRIIDGGDAIVVQARGKNLTSDGHRYDNDYVFVIHFNDGKILRYEEYCDTELIARVLPDRIAAKSIRISE